MSLAISLAARGTASLSCRAVASLAFLALSGCTGFISQSGPRMDDVMQGARLQTGDPGTPQHPRLDYAVITLDPTNVSMIADEPPDPGFAAGSLNAAPADIRIGVGDIISATIFEAQSGGLFIPAEPGTHAGNFIQLPAQQINTDGTYSVPFGGTVRAVGLTPAQLQRAIAATISTRALEPQVIVTVQERRANDVNVTGDVNSSTRFGIDPGGENLLGAIARAGGPRFPTYESQVTLLRRGTRQQASLADLVNDPRENIELRPGDSIIITHQPRYFLALGAVGQSASITQLNRRFPFEDSHLSLTDAIARAGGLADDLANPRAVFLFRFEHSALLRQLGLPIAPNAPADMPTVYRADFSNPSTLFLANSFPMRNNDLIYVSNAPYTDYQKFLSVILPLAQSAAAGRATVNP